MSKPSRLVIPLLVACCLSPLASAKDYYKWTDQNGSTHYSSKPPPKNAKNAGKLSTYDWSAQPVKPTTSSSQSSTISPQQPTQQNEANEALKQGQTRSNSSSAPSTAL